MVWLWLNLQVRLVWGAGKDAQGIVVPDSDPLMEAEKIEHTDDPCVSHQNLLLPGDTHLVEPTWPSFWFLRRWRCRCSPDQQLDSGQSCWCWRAAVSAALLGSRGSGWTEVWWTRWAQVEGRSPLSCRWCCLLPAGCPLYGPELQRRVRRGVFKVLIAPSHINEESWSCWRLNRSVWIWETASFINQTTLRLLQQSNSDQFVFHHAHCR